MKRTMTVRYLVLLVALGLLNACGNPPQSSPQEDKPQQETAQGGQDQAAGTQAAAKRPAAMEQKTVAKTVSIPAGTVLSVRLDQAVGSKVSKAGDAFSGVVVQPVMVGQQVAIPRNAEVRGTVAEAVPLGKIKGGARLQLRVNTLLIDRSEFQVQAEPLVYSAQGKGKRSAGLIGGGAAAGAVIGGLTGGGKGAAIGAGVGAGAGTAGAVMTGNNDILLPVETMLSVRLAEPLVIK